MLMLNASNRKIILAVDDMSMNLRTIKVSLEKFFDIRLAKSGELALSILRTTRVDLILMDIEMPDMSGFEVLEFIKKLPELKEIPVIFVTSHVSTDLITKALRSGARDYIMKPFEPDVLLRKVYAALNGVDMKHVFISKDGKCFIVPPTDTPAVRVAE
jgi:CheY-like chemotaxis protein